MHQLFCVQVATRKLVFFSAAIVSMLYTTFVFFFNFCVWRKWAIFSEVMLQLFGWRVERGIFNVYRMLRSRYLINRNFVNYRIYLLYVVL